MISEINRVCSNFYILSIRNPYDYLYLNQNINYCILYETTPNSMRSIVKYI